MKVDGVSPDPPHAGQWRWDYENTLTFYPSAPWPPGIVPPVAGRIHTLRSGDAGRRTIPLQAEAAPGVTKLFWFSAREFLGSTDPATPWLWHAVPGSPQIRVMDDQGRSAPCPVRVELVP